MILYYSVDLTEKNTSAQIHSTRLNLNEIFVKAKTNKLDTSLVFLIFDLRVPCYMNIVDYTCCRIKSFIRTFKMEFSTPKAIHQIKSNHLKTMLVDGQKCCPLEAMTIAFKYHKVDITITASCMMIKGLTPVVRNDKYLLK
jgi:hypothetical protein